MAIVVESRDDARARLARLVASTEDPVLDDTALDGLLDDAARADVERRVPFSTGWAETWDIDQAAADGWRWKAGQVAAYFRFETDGQQFHRDQVQAQCLRMADEYAARISRSLRLA